MIVTTHMLFDYLQYFESPFQSYSLWFTTSLNKCKIKLQYIAHSVHIISLRNNLSFQKTVTSLSIKEILKFI